MLCPQVVVTFFVGVFWMSNSNSLRGPFSPSFRTHCNMESCPILDIVLIYNLQFTIVIETDSAPDRMLVKKKMQPEE